jgi:nitroimidazol reductase NimA-like FMN-containing flavoprotein (pyridoxamine 5'-phosphate oxidase superfamily)
MRRKDREMPREFAERVIDKCRYGVLATVNPDGSPYCVPLSPAREGEWIYFHCAHEGHKIDNLKNEARVCLSCVGETRIPPGKFTIEYESAVVFGSAVEVLEDAEKIHALHLICERYTPGNMAAFDDTVRKDPELADIWKIRIETITGKQNRLSG